jgi:hypothetical protein
MNIKSENNHKIQFLYFFVVGLLFSCGSILRKVGRGNTSNWALNLTSAKLLRLRLRSFAAAG